MECNFLGEKIEKRRRCGRSRPWIYGKHSDVLPRLFSISRLGPPQGCKANNTITDGGWEQTLTIISIPSLSRLWTSILMISNISWPNYHRETGVSFPTDPTPKPRYACIPLPP